MATTTAPTGATNILSSFLPRKAETAKASSTETTQTNLTEDAINEIIRGMMESDSGLASILQGQAGKGLYNSSTTKLLTNDLAARVAGKAALASAPTTVSRTGTEKKSAGGVDPKMSAGMKLLEALVGKAFGSDPRTGGNGGAGGRANPNTRTNNSFQSMLDQVLGRKGGKQDGTGEAFADTGGGFGTLGGSGFSPAGSFDFSAPSLGFTGGGGNGNFGSLDLGNLGGGFGNGGFDSLSFGLGGGGYEFDKYSMTGGNNFALGTMSGGSSLDNFDFNSFSGGNFNSNSYEPIDYGFSSSNFWG